MTIMVHFGRKKRDIIPDPKNGRKKIETQRAQRAQRAQRMYGNIFLCRGSANGSTIRQGRSGPLDSNDTLFKPDFDVALPTVASAKAGATGVILEG